MKPIVYLLCGLPGSGKTTYAKNLEKEGVVRLTLDEEVFRRFGREYSGVHAEKQEQTKQELKELLKEKLRAGESAVVDFGFWKKADRDEYKLLVEENGGEWKFLYFKASKETLIGRLASRNTSDSGNNHIIDETLLEKFITEFEAPEGESETVIEQ